MSSGAGLVSKAMAGEDGKLTCAGVTSEVLGLEQRGALAVLVGLRRLVIPATLRTASFALVLLRRRSASVSCDPLYGGDIFTPSIVLSREGHRASE